jgi:hypothetical protein
MKPSPIEQISFPSEVSSIMPRHRINGIYPVAPVVAIMIGNEARPTVSINGPVEVVENEESGEPETGEPEWVRDPCVHVIVIPGRGIVSDDGRSLIVVIVDNDIRI